VGTLRDVQTALTTTSRAAAARSRRRAADRRPGAVLRDPCPRCGVELGQAHGATRRLAVVSSTRGVFRWSCPDCRQGWSEGASTQAGSTTRSVPLPH